MGERTAACGQPQQGGARRSPRRLKQSRWNIWKRAGGKRCMPREPRDKTAVLFPAVFLYLELILRLRTGLSLDYAPVFAAFGISAGLLCAALLELFPARGRRPAASVLALLLGVLYGGELLCKQILQTYYPLVSTAGTAADNRLTDYAEAVWAGVGEELPWLLLFLLPAAVMAVLGKRLFLGPGRKGRKLAGLAAGAVVFHLLGLGALSLPWQGDLRPAELYRSDENVEDQVEQLGLWPMLRLDAKHALFPPERRLDGDFSRLDTLGSASAAGEAEESPQETEEESEAKLRDQVMDVDLEALASGTDNEDVKWLAGYFSSVPPTRTNEYTGKFAGYNVIFVTLEGFSGYVIDPELTPTLYRLTHEGFVFPNYYTPLHYTSTSGGECQNLLGLYPKAGNPITMKETGRRKTDCYFNLAEQLGRLGYTTLGYHGNGDMYGRYASHTNLGYTWKQYGTGLELEMQGDTYAWPQSDVYVVQKSMPEYLEQEEPFLVYYLTISGHMPYNFNRVAGKYRELVEELPYSQTTKAYAATAIEVDRMFQTLLDSLEEAGKLDNTLIVATADHIPYANVETLEELSGRTFGSSDDIRGLNERNIDFDVYRNALILWAAGMEEPVVVDKPCGQVDILPTVSNLLGLEYDSRMLAGADLLSDAPGLVVFSSRSWLTDRGLYNRYTQTFTPSEGTAMTEEEQSAYVESVKRSVEYKLGCTEKLLNTDFYRLAFAGGGET